MNFGCAGQDVDSLTLAAVTAGIGFPPARPAIQLTRSRRSRIDCTRHTETGYAGTEMARGPGRPSRRRRPRAVVIENRL